MIRPNIKVLMFLMGDFLKFSSWSEGLAHSESTVQDVNTVVCQIRVWCVVLREKKLFCYILYFFLKSEIIAVGKFPNHVNIILCDYIFDTFFSIFASHRSRNFVYESFTPHHGEHMLSSTSSVY